MRLSTKVAFAIALPLAAALALMAYMNFERFGRVYRDVSQSRVGAILLDARDAVEAGITLGLSPSGLSGLQGTLGRYAEGDPALLALAVADEGGKIVLSAGRAAEGALAGVGVAAAWERQGVAPLPTGATGQAALGVPLSDARGARVGTVVLVYSTAGVEAGLAEVRGDLVALAVGVLAIASLVAFVVAARALRPIAREFGEMTHRIQESRRRREAAGGAPDREQVLSILLGTGEGRAGSKVSP
jgi:hypothetical protein